VSDSSSPVDLDPAAITEALTEYVRRGLAGPRATVTDVRHLSEGWETVIHAFVLADEDTGRREDLVLRAYPGQYAAYKAQAEYQVMLALERAGYPVPHLHTLELDPTVLGRPFLLMERIDGGPASRTIFPAPVSERSRLFGDFAGLLHRMHSLDWRRFAGEAPDIRKPWTPASFSDVGAFNRQWLAGIRGFYGSRGLVGLEPAFDWLLDHLDSAGEAQLALVHGDYHMQNVLLTGTGRSYVIDWTNAEIADYRYDLAWTLLLQGMYDGWAVREAILAAYEAHLGHPVEGLGVFEAFVCARRLFSMLASLAHGAESLGMRPGAADVMRKQLGHMEAIYLLLCARTGLAFPETEAILAKLRRG
jgi:aminoglycoside phosphotransferase (APT) family kinase protein